MEHFCKNNDDGVEYYSKFNKPKDKHGYFNFIGVTKDEVDTALANGTGVLFESRQALKQNLAYWFQRRAAYPSTEEQLDKLYHDGYDAWKASIQAVKNQFPKP
jgi:hypothetical protein